MNNLKQIGMNLKVQMTTEFQRTVSPEGEVSFSYVPKTISIASLSNEEQPTEFFNLRSINGKDYELSVHENFSDVISAEKMSVAQLLTYAYNMCDYTENNY